MIETYKILTGIYDGEVVPTMKLNKDTRTRGNSMKMETSRTRLIYVNISSQSESSTDGTDLIRILSTLVA
jgi:hypothetical protein